jgi:GH24 family phage-related lysozyme (muramidase)
MFSTGDVISRQKIFEGFNSRPYRDSVHGIWTIGYGATVWNGVKVSPTTRIVTITSAHNHMKKDMWTALHDCQWLYRDTFSALSHTEQEVLIHMSFQLGGPKLKRFVRMNEAVRRKDANAWADEMKDSLWYNQTRRVASALLEAVLQGEWQGQWVMS